MTGRTDGRASKRWIVTLLATAASTWALDATAAAAGVAVAASSAFDGWSGHALAVVLATSYVVWAAGIAVNLRANAQLLDATGVSTNALSKLAYDLAGRRSPGVRALAASCGYVATELVKELPYFVAAIGAALASTTVDGVDAVAFLVGANVAAAAYELVVAAGTRVYLQRPSARQGPDAAHVLPQGRARVEGVSNMRSSERRHDIHGLAAAHAAFVARFPGFDPDGSFAELRRTEYGRLDAASAVYLDHTGGGLYAASQLTAHVAHLASSVLGNPHSGSSASLASTAGVEQARRAVLSFFGADPAEYACVFTANASNALKLVGESYPFRTGSVFALTADNHNSVNGIRELAGRAGAAVEYVPIVAPELRVDRAALHRTLTATPSLAAPRLLAFPAQSNYSGVQHPLEIVAQAHEHGWDVLLDASAFVPTNRLDLAEVHPDFVVCSVYKIAGYPTGVGCLLARHDRLAALVRPWFAGGTVAIASVGARRHCLHAGPAGFEDGTVDYLGLPAVTAGLAHVEAVGRDAIHRRVAALTAWLLDELVQLRHRDGRPLVRVLGPADTDGRGATIAFMVHDADGSAVDGRVVESMADRDGIAVRSGCFCNPGAGEAALGIAADQIAPWFERRGAVSFDELSYGMRRDHGKVLAAVRASFGLASNFADAYRLVSFLEGLVDGDRSALGREPAVSVPA